MTEVEKLTPQMNIADVVRRYPQTIGVFFEHGLGCIGCQAARFENIEQGARAHGINVERLMNDLNKVVSGEKE